MSAALAYVTTHYKTSLVGVAFVLLGVASYLGVPLPADLHLTPTQLVMDGLAALGFIVAKG